MVVEITVQRTELVRRVQMLTVEFDSIEEAEALLESDTVAFDEVVCNDGTLDHEDHEPVDDRDLTLDIISG